MDTDDNNSNPLYLEFNFDGTADELSYPNDSYMEDIYQTQHAQLSQQQQQYCLDGGASGSTTDPSGTDVIQYATGNEAYTTLTEYGGHQLYATDDDSLNIKHMVSQLKQEGSMTSNGGATVYKQRVVVAAPRMVRKTILVPRPVKPKVETRDQGQQTRQRKQLFILRKTDIEDAEVTIEFVEMDRAEARKVETTADIRVVVDAPDIVEESTNNTAHQLRARVAIDATGIATPVRPSKRVFQKPARPPKSKKRLLNALNTNENAA